MRCKYLRIREVKTSTCPFASFTVPSAFVATAFLVRLSRESVRLWKMDLCLPAYPDTSMVDDKVVGIHVLFLPPVLLVAY